MQLGQKARPLLRKEMGTHLAKDGNDFGSGENLMRIALQATFEALHVCDHGPMLNERYLHHFMSHKLQEHLDLSCLKDIEGKPLLHPEWPTWKKSTGIKCGQYVGVRNGKNKKEYLPVNLPKRGAGFIDFTLGDYHRPSVAIEVTLKKSWSHEEIVYDLVKLLDCRNDCFRTVISCNIIRREKQLSKKGNKKKLHRRMNEAYTDAKDRLGDMFCHDDRGQFFVITEIAGDQRRHWCFDTATEEFHVQAHIGEVLQS